MTKIVYNSCFGGFGLSEKAMARYAELKGWTVHDETGYCYLLDSNGIRQSRDDIDRADPLLAQVVEELGGGVNTRFSNLKIRDLPPGTRYIITEYDGNEGVVTIDEHDWDIA
jgi:hypothetical protein